MPGARLTTAFRINSRGDIVGQYVDQDVVTRGFILRKGEFTTIDYPGAAGTQLRGIGSGGEIVGTYRLPGEPAVNIHGFLLKRDGSFEPVDYPGHINTIPQRILPNGTVLGCRHDEDTMGSMVGVVIAASGNSEIDAFASMHNGATPDLRRIAGLFTNMETGQGQGSNFTAAWGVNPAGDVAGIYRAGTVFYGFVMTRAGFVTVEFPGALATRVFGINAGGDVVGSYVLRGRTFAFLASATRGHNR